MAAMVGLVDLVVMVAKHLIAVLMDVVGVMKEHILLVQGCRTRRT